MVPHVKVALPENNFDIIVMLRKVKCKLMRWETVIKLMDSMVMSVGKDLKSEHLLIVKIG